MVSLVLVDSFQISFQISLFFFLGQAFQISLVKAVERGLREKTKVRFLYVQLPLCPQS